MPAEPFHLDIVTPEAPLFSGRASYLRAPGVLGPFGVLPRHAPMVAAFGPGEIRYTEAGTGETHSLAVDGGVVQVTPDQVSILAETRAH